MRWPQGVVLSSVVLLACGAPIPAADSGTDGGVDTSVGIASPDIPWLLDEEPLLDVGFCPAGLPECDPDVLIACGPGEAHFPGEPGCHPVGGPCPAGDFREGLADDGSVVFVSPRAPAGGDGSMATPYALLSSVRWTSLASGTTVALAKGEYEATLPLRPGVSVVGACAQETIIRGLDAPVPAVVTVVASGDSASVRNVWIRGAEHRGVRVEDGRSLALVGVIVDGTRWSAVSVTGAGTEVTLEDVVVMNTRPRTPDNETGRGINVQAGARLTGTRVLVAGNRDVGIYASGEGTEVFLTDAIVSDTQGAASNGLYGFGLDIESGARVEATRMLISGNRSAGVIVDGVGSKLVLSQAVVRDNRETEGQGTLGRGLQILTGGVLEASRVFVYRNVEVGIHVSDPGSAATLTDVLVSDTSSRALDGIGGRGLNVQADARLDGSRVAVVRARSFAVLSVMGSSVELEDVFVEDLDRTACASSSCPLLAFGHAVAGISASLRMTRFVIRDSETCGVFVGSGPGVSTPTAVDLTSGRVSQTDIGACVQEPGYDIARLSTDVEYTDNGTSLDSTMLPVPTSIGGR